jgi:hypothetical protein
MELWTKDQALSFHRLKLSRHIFVISPISDDDSENPHIDAKEEKG